jgi:nitrogen fixation/metabolism regulation signal transduction histidine kinase
MKITTRIATGYGLFVAILVALAVYQAIAINSMQSVNRSFSGAGFQNAKACLEASRDRDLVEEYTRKSFARAADPDCSKELQESQRAYDARLKEIKTYAQSNEELAEVQRLSQLWESYLAEQGILLHNLPRSGNALPESLQNSLDQLRAQTLSVYRVALRSMSSNADKSRKAVETAALVLYCATAIAFAISILVSFLIFRSISKPLANLAEGTRSLAEGKLFYRLDTSGNDELSQLAKDFNSLTRRLNELEKPNKTDVQRLP